MTRTEWLSLVVLGGIIGTGLVDLWLARRVVARLKSHSATWRELGCPERPGGWLRAWVRSGIYRALQDPELNRIVTLRRRLEVTTLAVGMLVLSLLWAMGQ